MIRFFALTCLFIGWSFTASGQTESETIRWLSTYPERMTVPCCDWIVDYRCDIILFKDKKAIRMIETRYAISNDRT